MKKQSVVPSAPANQRIGKAEVSSGKRGKPFDALLSKIEARHPGIEAEIGVSSAAVRAGRQVREMRLAKGLTQTQLAAALDWDQVRISNIERGEGTLGPTFDVLQKVAAACGYDIEFKAQAEKPSLAAKMLSYAEILQDIAKLAVDSGAVSEAVVATPPFAAACVAFGRSVGAAKTHFSALEKNLVRQEMGDIAYVEMSAAGKRMVMLPVLVEEVASPSPGKTSAQLEVKLALPKL